MLTLLYCLFTLLYTLYIAGHPHRFGPHKGDHLFYCVKFLLVDGYLFFIWQGLIFRSKNWGILLLLPLVMMVLTIIGGFLMVWIVRLSGGNLLDRDYTDMILLSLIWLTLSIYALKFISTGKKARK